MLGNQWLKYIYSRTYVATYSLVFTLYATLYFIFTTNILLFTPLHLFIDFIILIHYYHIFISEKNNSAVLYIFTLGTLSIY